MSFTLSLLVLRTWRLGVGMSRPTHKVSEAQRLPFPVTSVITMALHVTSWQGLNHVSEEFGPDTGECRYTSLAVVTDDATVYVGQLNTHKLEISLSQLTSSLRPLPDEDVLSIHPT